MTDREGAGCPRAPSLHCRSRDPGRVKEGGVVPRAVRPFVVPPDGGKSIRGPVGGPTLIKAGTDQTGGTFNLIQNVIPPRESPPLHVHAREDEMWYVLHGALRIRADDDLLEASQGSFVFIPRGTRHCFQNTSDREATLLVMFTPRGNGPFF